MSGAAHRHLVRVYYEDTDAGGIVYYANYLKFAERARTELLRDRGLDHNGLMTAHGGMFAVRRCSADYRAPARLDDLLEIVTSITDTAGARLEMLQEVRRDGQVLVAVAVTLVFLGADLRPRRLPAAVRHLIAGCAAAAPLEGAAAR
ncbi:tol-pal system-associated acyl-CoA thioesterase [Geminicoccaceae bacterium 1502E]|nr:tol-pal system-associated acyl-CoA thioesterase [Geminicoccaceae bacterium 1502E]